jgi:di/tricarboxylate transporter
MSCPGGQRSCLTKRELKVASQQFDYLGYRWLFVAGFLAMFFGAALSSIAGAFSNEYPAYEQTAWHTVKWIGATILFGGAAVSIGAAIRLYVLEKPPRK